MKTVLFKIIFIATLILQIGLVTAKTNTLSEKGSDIKGFPICIGTKECFVKSVLCHTKSLDPATCESGAFFSSLFTMEIYSSDGKLLLMQRSSSEKEFSIASLQPGEYKMLIYDENNTVIFYETIVKPACVADKF